MAGRSLLRYGEPIFAGRIQANTNKCVKSHNLLPGEKWPFLFVLKKKRLSTKTNT